MALGFVVAFAANTAFATTYRLASPEDMALEADLIFMGTVSSVSAEARDDRPWTLVQFDDLDILFDREAESKGEEPAAEKTLGFLGGTVAGGPTLLVSGLPAFDLGERWLVLAYQDGGLASPVVGVSQGAWKFGAGGAQATDGSYLSVNDSGALVRGASSPSSEDLRAALTALLERGVRSAARPTDAAEPEAAAAVEPSFDTQAETPAKTPEVLGPETPSQDSGAEHAAADAVDALDETTAPAPPAPSPSGEAAPAQESPKVVNYQVDDEGGPLLLSSFAAAAADVWEAAAPSTVAFEVDESSTARIRYGTLELMGTDATSYTLVRPGGRIEVLVSPLVGDELRAVMVHELGVLLGLPEGGAGVMSRTVSATFDAPTSADLMELRDLRTYVPEDLDRSGSVDFYDLALFGLAYGKSGVNLAADFNGDGRVDDADLTLLREAYEFAPPQETAPH